MSNPPQLSCYHHPQPAATFPVIFHRCVHCSDIIFDIFFSSLHNHNCTVSRCQTIIDNFVKMKNLISSTPVIAPWGQHQPQHHTLFVISVINWTLGREFVSSQSEAQQDGDGGNLFCDEIFLRKPKNIFNFNKSMFIYGQQYFLSFMDNYFYKVQAKMIWYLPENFGFWILN